MNMKRLLSRLLKEYAGFYCKGACGYMRLELGPKPANELKLADPSKKPATAARADLLKPPASQESIEGLSGMERSLLEGFSTLSEEDRSALMRFVSYAAKFDDAAASDDTAASDETPDTGADAAIAGWLDEQARLHTQS